MEPATMISSIESAIAHPRKFHFISGLPRSGSTLLSAILRQNPRFSAGVSSSLCPLFTSAMNVMGGEGSALIGDLRRENVLRGLFASWAADLPEGAVVFDTSRFWTARLPALLRLFPEAKIICTVRSVAAIMDSIERLMRANPLLPSRLFNDAERANVYTRTDALSQRDRLVGGPWTCLKEAFYGPDAASLLVIDYDHLARAPTRVVSLLYSFIGEEPFAHDFGNIVYDEPTFDEELRMPGLHRVLPRVSFEPRASVLPHDLYERFSAQSFWTAGTPSKANLIAPKQGE
jgi:sulfotransferase